MHTSQLVCMYVRLLSAAAADVAWCALPPNLPDAASAAGLMLQGGRCCAWEYSSSLVKFMEML